MPIKKYGASATLDDVLSERHNDARTILAIENGKLLGRFNPVGRAVPSSHSNVIQGDAQGDVITDATYVYTLLSVSGALVWHRVALSIAW